MPKNINRPAATTAPGAMVVVINEPKGEAKGGGAVAAPVFGQVAARALRLLGVRPDGANAI